MKTFFLSTPKRNELPAGFMLASILIAAFLVKTGLGWCGVAVMIAMCIFDVVCKSGYIANAIQREGASTDPGVATRTNSQATQAQREPQLAMAA